VAKGLVLVPDLRIAVRDVVGHYPENVAGMPARRAQAYLWELLDYGESLHSTAAPKHEPAPLHVLRALLDESRVKFHGIGRINRR
jgi:hypothetical protein